MRIDSMLPFRPGSSSPANLVGRTIIMLTLLPLLLLATMQNYKLAFASDSHQANPLHNYNHKQQQQQQNNLQSNFDEEIILEPNHDYEKTSVVEYTARPSSAQQTAHDHNNNSNNSNNNNNKIANSTANSVAGQRLQSQVQNFDPNDPFAATFEDYLRDSAAAAAAPTTTTTETTNAAATNKSLSHRTASDDSSFSSSSDASLFTAIPDTVGLIIEDEENLVRPRESRIIDYIFPAPKHEGAEPTGGSGGSGSSNINKSGTKVEPTADQMELLNEIRLLFAWKQVPTNKCSRACGKGFRVKHLSCVDLKYNVRVEDELCLKSKLTRPNETSDETCNEIDCPPQWTSVEFQECTQSNIQDGVCRPNLYKRVQCTMVNKSGISIYLDDSKCNSSAISSIDQHSNVTLSTATIVTNAAASDAIAETRGQTTTAETQVQSAQAGKEEAPSVRESAKDYETVEGFIIDDSLESADKNDILSNIDFGAQQSAPTLSEKGGKAHQQQHHPTNEPFYEPGPWSDCSGAACGQLGKRFRKLSCRLRLSRSSRFAELPESSCHSALMPDIQEPCYMDCPPAESEDGSSADTKQQNDSDENNNSSSSSSTSSRGSQGNRGYEDETVFDAEMTRFVWRKDGWTKCSADCLGGQRETIVECWDKIIESAVEQALCDQELRPQVDTEVCNVGPCQPEWRLEEFSKCTKQCGSSGIKTRSIACAQQVPTRDGGPSYMVVSNDLCFQTNGSMPHKIEPCNRIDCKPEWSVGPWSECSKKCGQGIKNRTVICVQEFANKNGPTREMDDHHLLANGDHLRNSFEKNNKRSSLELLEAVSVSARDWHPGKVTQVPFHECYEEYRTVPALDEKCFNPCESEPYIDSEPDQNYRMTHESSKRRTVTLRVGGRAVVPEGRNLKIRCRVINRIQSSLRDNNLVINSSSSSSININNNNNNNRRNGDLLVDWRKDGIQIFLNGSTMADKQYIQDDNSIFGNDDVFSDEKLNQYMADEPNGANKRSTSNTNRLSTTLQTNTNQQQQLQQQHHYHHTHHITPSRVHSSNSRQRNLVVRSWNSNNNNYSGSQMQIGLQQQQQGNNNNNNNNNNYHFVPQAGGRFSLVKENTLRIKRLRADDSGLYTCSYGSLSESIELKVISRSREPIDSLAIGNNLGR